MKTASTKHRAIGAYTLVECMVYIFVLFLLLGVGYAAVYRCIANSVALRRSADDITAALHAGERWRADIRSATQVHSQDAPDGHLLQLAGGRNPVSYLLSTNSLLRRVGQGPWSQILSNIKSSNMQADARADVTAWRWELELQIRAKTSRVRPLFTFIAVPRPGSNP